MAENENKHDTTYVVVLDYSNCSVKFYQVNDLDDCKGDVEEWLKTFTDYNDSNCYYMFSKQPFEIKINDVLKVPNERS